MMHVKMVGVYFIYVCTLQNRKAHFGSSLTEVLIFHKEMLFLLYKPLYSNMIYCQWDEMGCISI